MGFINDLFGSKSKNTDPEGEPVLVDMHSHLLPGIDDGSSSLEQSLELIKGFVNLGYKKLITTPHINGDFYKKNSPELIYYKLDELQNFVKQAGINIEIEAAAEYFLDESFLQKLNSNEKMMTFGENYLLFETSYLNEPSFLAETIFNIKASGYWPVLAHPERYTYFYTDFGKLEEIYSQGISFQLNLNSIIGYYSKNAEQLAHKLIKNSMVNFVGSDCHNIKHIEALKKTHLNKEYRKVLNLPLLNNSLL